MAWSDSSYSFEPLCVTATFRCGVVSDRWLPLDGILLYQSCREQFGPQTITTPGGSQEPADVAMPLKVIHPGEDHWYYACSWAQPQPWWVAEALDYWNKRFDASLADLIDFAGRRGNVLFEKGRYRAYHTPVHYRVAAQVQWYCVGDRRAIEHLLSTCTHVGKKTAQGWGRVVRWQVEPWPEDWSVRRGCRLTRGVPLQDALPGEEGQLVFYGLRPGYYRKENQMPVVMPL